MNQGFSLWVCANAGPVYGCRTPGDPCVDNAAGLANVLYPPLDGSSMEPISSVRWELLAIGLQDVEYFHALDVLAQRLELAGAGCGGGNRKTSMGEDCNETSAKTDTDAVAMCCNAARSAKAALDRVGDVVWGFPSSTNLSSATYSDDVVLMHSVLDGVLEQIHHAKTVLAAVTVGSTGL